MPIMGCYPDRRAIENELGGNWEKFYEYTFDDSHTESFEFPHDLDKNESPLNLNGVLVYVRYPLNTTIENNTWRFFANGYYLGYLPDGGTVAGEQTNSLFKVKVENGLLENTSVIRSAAYANATLRRSSNLYFANAITSFQILPLNNAQKWTAGTKIEFYVLRGV